MPTDDQIFAMIAERRRAVADTLAALNPEQADTPSLCDGWTVHQVAAHLTMPFRVKVPAIVSGLVRHRGSFDRMSHAWAVDAAAASSMHDLAALLRMHAQHRFTPPGFGPEAPLTDTCVHAFDIGVPLGAPPEIPVEQIEVALGNLVRPKAAKAFSKPGLYDGLHLRATDSSWAHGSGVDVAGPAWALMLVASGRPAGLAALDGAGVPTLTARLG